MSVIHDPFEETSQLLTMAADAIRSYLEQEPPAWRNDSPAAAEAESLDWAGAWGERPLFDVLHEPLSLLAHASDHLRGMAVTTAADRVVISTVSLVRPILESTGTAYYILDSAISPRERLRRGMNLRVESMQEQLNMLNASDADEEVRQAAEDLRVRLHRIEVSAREQGFDWNRAKRRAPALEPPKSIGPATPRDMALVRGVLEQKVPAQLAATIHRATSAILHAQGHGLAAFWIRGDAQPVGTGSAMLMPIGTTSTMVGIWALIVLVATDSVMSEACRHYGWDSAPWQGVADHALPRLVAIATAGPTP
jgi:hypothetical protein